MKQHMMYNFKDNRIRVINDEQGRVDKICLTDVCKVLDRQSMVEDGQAQQICKTSIQLYVRKNWPLVWYADTFDIHPLLNKIRKENGMVAKICDELEHWVSNLPTLRHPIHTPLTSEDKKKPVVYRFNSYPVTFKVDNNTVLVNATEMTRCFNKTPKDYLQLVSTTKYRESLVDCGDFADIDSQLTSIRGTNGGTWFHEKLAEHLANWLVPDNELLEWMNDRIDELKSAGYVEEKITYKKPEFKKREPVHTSPPHQSEETGLSVSEQSSHILKQLIPSQYEIPDTYSGALQLAGQLMAKVEELGHVIIANQHKVDFYNYFIEEREWFKTSSIADELRMSVVQLNRFLLENKIIHYDAKFKQYAVFSQYRSLQCEVPYEWTNKLGKTYKYGVSKRWTHAGREFILELWNKENPGQKLLI